MSLVQKNQQRWESMHILPSRINEISNIAKRLTASAAKARYQQIEKATNVPWFIIAVIHERESTQNFTRQLAQGDPLSQVSTHVPKGRGPFFNHPNDPAGHDAFYRGALDALIDCPPYASKWADWSPGGSLTLLVEYNGLGYENRGIPSPYIWAGSDQYSHGKYIADGVFDASVVDEQIGCAPIIKVMMQLDPTIKWGNPSIINQIKKETKTMTLTNWKTTLAGVAAILTAIAGVITQLTTGMYGEILATLAGGFAGLGAIFAKDFNVTGGTVPTPPEAIK